MGMRFFRLVPLGMLIVLPTLGAPASADPRANVIAGSSRCDGIPDDRTWLDCYYGAAQPLRAKLGLPPAPASQQALVPPARPGTPAPVRPAATASDKSSDGVGNFFQRLMKHTTVKDEAPTRMTAYKFDQGGFFTVTLANGEVWEQASLDTTVAKWRNPPQSYSVRILTGSKMEVAGHELYQVERVQ